MRAVQSVAPLLSVLENYPCPNFISTISKPALYKHRRQPHTHTPTLTMGIPVLLNPFGAERSTRQRLLNAIQQTGDYIMSQQVLMTASTLATKTLFCPKL